MCWPPEQGTSLGVSCMNSMMVSSVLYSGLSDPALCTLYLHPVLPLLSWSVVWGVDLCTLYLYTDSWGTGLRTLYRFSELIIFVFFTCILRFWSSYSLPVSWGFDLRTLYLYPEVLISVLFTCILKCWHLHSLHVSWGVDLCTLTCILKYIIFTCIMR